MVISGPVAIAAIIYKFGEIENNSTQFSMIGVEAKNNLLTM
jgi:hypothetical protein